MSKRAKPAVRKSTCKKPAAKQAVVTSNSSVVFTDIPFSCADFARQCMDHLGVAPAAGAKLHLATACSGFLG